MLKLKNKNGITLIALVISIMVMLILVGVSVALAINGNIFNKTKETGDKQGRAAEMELLQARIFDALGENEKLDFSKLQGYEGKSETYRGRTTGTYITKNRNTFTVDEDGTVTDITDLAKYLLGENLQGRYLVNLAMLESGQADTSGIVGIDSENAAFVCLQDPQNSNSKIHEQTTLHAQDNVWNKIITYIPKEKIEACYMIVVVEYKGEYYCLGTIMDDETGVLYSMQGTLFKVFIGEDTLGKYVTYKGKTWIVINDSNKVELLASDSMGSVAISFSSGYINSDKANKESKEAYNKILEECKKETGITENIRPISYSTDLLDADIDSKIENILLTGEPYWLSGTIENDYNDNRIWKMHYIKADGTFGREPMNSKSLNDDGQYDYYSEGATYAVRPVVTLPAGTLDNISGDGSTPETAIQLD